MKGKNKSLGKMINDSSESWYKKILLALGIGAFIGAVKLFFMWLFGALS